MVVTVSVPAALPYNLWDAGNTSFSLSYTLKFLHLYAFLLFFFYLFKNSMRLQCWFAVTVGNHLICTIFEIIFSPFPLHFLVVFPPRPPCGPCPALLPCAEESPRLEPSLSGECSDSGLVPSAEPCPQRCWRGQDRRGWRNEEEGKSTELGSDGATWELCWVLQVWGGSCACWLLNADCVLFCGGCGKTRVLKVCWMCCTGSSRCPRGVFLAWPLGPYPSVLTGAVCQGTVFKIHLLYPRIHLLYPRKQAQVGY